VNRALWWILGGVVAAIAVATVVVGVSSMPSDEDVAAYQHGYNASEYGLPARRRGTAASRIIRRRAVHGCLGGCRRGAHLPSQ
jgi:hypothetical protein